MADIVDVSLSSATESELSSREIGISRLWGRIALGAIMLLTIFMHFFQLGQNGYGNLYYASGVRSMTDSWHNFFFVSFDPGGFVTIDKPPLGFWLQTLSAKIFGFTPFSIFLPQALCGVLAVLLLNFLVRRHFGTVAGLLAALALAVSPISVVTDRNNTIDGTLALVLLLAAWAIIHASETGKLRWLLLSSVFVGLGFNIKMAEAYLVVPALGLTYLLCAPHKLWTRIWHLLLALLILLLISLSWAATVDLTPASQRPYVGSTQNNSEISLASGYNGLNRLRLGGGNSFGGIRRGTPTNRTGTTSSTRAARTGTPTSTNTATGAGTPVATNTGTGSTNTATGRSGSSTPSGNNSTGNTGSTGTTQGNRSGTNGIRTFQGGGNFFQSATPMPLRLFSASLGGQIAWLLPFALLGILALACQRRFNFQRDRRQLGLVLWGCWLLTMTAFFTLDSSFHQYYMTEMAPGLSALVGIGLVVMWQGYRGTGWRSWLLPISLVVTAAAQIYMLTSYPAWSRWLSPLIGVLTVLVVGALILFRFRDRLRLGNAIYRFAGVAVSIGMLALLVAPTVWAGYSVLQNTEDSAPMAGPSAQSSFVLPANIERILASNARNGQRTGTTRSTPAGFAGFAGFFGGGSGRADPALIAYLEAHQGNTKFLVATPSSMTADAIILTTNKPVMAMGGFSGGDPILTTSDLQTLVSNGTVRYFLINPPPATGFAGNTLGFGQNALSVWVSDHCTVVPASAWQSSTQRGNTGIGNSQLYDCASAHS